jgi:outer membrane receptor protein involved in Fe transport
MRVDSLESPGLVLARSENLGMATIWGGEISLNFRSRSGNRSFLNYSYQNARYGESGDPLEYAPAHKLNLGWAFDAGRGLSATLLVDYVGTRRTDTDVCRWMGGYGIVDTILRWQAPHGIEYSLSVYNLFDRRYEEMYDFPQAGRTWRLAAALRY